MGAVTADAAADGYRRAAARDGQITVRLTHNAGSLLGAGVDSASYMQVLNRGVLHVAERSAILLAERRLGSTVVEGQRVAVAVKGALERVGLVGSHHRRDADVTAQFHELSAEGIVSVDEVGERVPVVGAADDEGSVLGA